MCEYNFNAEEAQRRMVESIVRGGKMGTHNCHFKVVDDTGVHRCNIDMEPYDNIPYSCGWRYMMPCWVYEKSLRDG